MTLGTKIGKVRGQIEEKLKFINQLRVKMHKSKTKDRIGKDIELWGSQLSLTRIKLHKIRS